MCMRVYMSTRVLLRSCMWRAEKGGQELLLQRGRGDPPQGFLCGGGRRDGAAPPPPPCPGNGPTCPALPPGVRGPRGWAAWPRSPSQFAEGPSARPRSRPGPWGAAPSSRGPGWAGAGAPGRGAGPRPPPGSGGLPGAQPRPGAPAAACAAPAHAAAPPSLRPVGCSAPAAGTRPPEGRRSAERKARLCGAAGGAAWAAREPERRPRPAAAAGRPGHVSAGERSPQRGRPQPLHNAAFVGPGGAPVGMNGARAS